MQLIDGTKLKKQYSWWDFIWMVTLQDFIHALETQNLFVKDNKTHRVRLTAVKVLFEWQHQEISSTASKVKVEDENTVFQ